MNKMKQLDEQKKKQQFINPRHNKLKLTAALMVLLIVAGVVTIVYFTLIHPPSDHKQGELVAMPRSYIGKVVEAKTIKPTVENGQVMINLSDVDQWNIVDFRMENDDGKTVPVLAYVTSSGRLFAGIGQCACGGQDFLLAGKALVCSTCRATYDIENQKYLSGAAICAQHPPKAVKWIIQDGLIILEKSEILNWRNPAD
jgi:hypothetical protein